MGKSIAKRFVQEGANVIGVARRKERLDELAEELKICPARSFRSAAILQSRKMWKA